MAEKGGDMMNLVKMGKMPILAKYLPTRKQAKWCIFDFLQSGVFTKSVKFVKYFDKMIVF